MLPDTKAQFDTDAGTKKKIPGSVPLNAKVKTMMPSGKMVSDIVLQSPNIKQYFSRLGYYSTPSLDPNVRDFYQPKSRSYWENPYRVARYHDYIRSQPPGWQAPPWLDVQGVEAAYKYLNIRNDNKPWTEWKYLPSDDEGTQFLQSLQNPPNEFLFPKEMAEIAEQQRQSEQNRQSVGSWEELEGGKPLFGIPGAPSWQSTMHSLTSPQPITAENPTGRPQGSMWLANLLRSGFTGLSGMGLSSGAAGMLAAVIAASGGTATIPIAAIGAVGGLLFLAAALYQNFSGNEAPVVGGIVSETGKIFTKLPVVGDIPQEKFWGIVQQLTSGDLDFEEILKWTPEAAAAWSAGEVAWETKQNNALLNTVAKLSGDEAPKEGEIWRFDLGKVEPQKIPEGFKYGVEALDDVKDRILAGGNEEEIKNEYVQAFGSQGILNDFVLSSVFDVKNVIPTAGAMWFNKRAVKSGNLAAQTAWSKPTLTNLAVDALPMPLNMIPPLISRGKWQGAPSVLDGVRKYKTFIQTGFMPGADGVSPDFKAAKDFSQLDKVVGELDNETGLPKYFVPDAPKTGIPKMLSWLFNLTPEAKIEISMANLMDHVGRSLTDAAAGDPNKMKRIINMYSKADPGATGEALGALLNPAGESRIDLDPRFFNGPIAEAATISIKKMVDDGKIDEFFLANWEAPAQKRTVLERSALLMGITPDELLARLNKDMDVAGTLKLKAQEAKIDGFDNLTNASLKELFGIFTGEKHLPANATEFQVKLTMMIDDGIQDFMIKRFGITPDSKFKRIMHVMKNVQGLLVLATSPSYLINNAINNPISRSATGVLGFMKNSDISTMLKRNGIEPYRPDVGLKKFGLAEEYGYDDYGRASKLSDVRRGENDLINAANGLFNEKSLAGKVGIFKRIAGALERSESRQAYSIAFRRIKSSLWIPGVGYPEIDKPLKMELDKIDPTIVPKINAHTRSSANEVEVDAIYDKNAPIRVEPLIDIISEKFAEQHKLIENNPEIYRDMLVNQGIADELNTLLPKAKNSADVDNIFDQVKSRSDEHIRNMRKTELDTRLEDVKNKVKLGGIQEASKFYTDVLLNHSKEWVKHWGELEELHRAVLTMEPAERNKAYKSQRAWDTMRFEDDAVWEDAGLKGLVDAMGQSKSQDAIEFLQNYKDLHKNWRDTYEAKHKIQDPFFDPKNNSKTWAEDFAKSKEKISELNNNAFIKEEELMLRADELYVNIIKAVGGDVEKAGIFRTAMRVMRQEMKSSISKQFQSFIDNPPESRLDSNARWNEFAQEVYVPKIREFKMVEAAAAQDLSGIKPSKVPAYSDAVKQAFSDWKEEKVYWDGNNNFRLVDNKRAFPAWNAEVKKEFALTNGVSTTEAFHKAATDFINADTAKAMIGEAPGQTVPDPTYQGKALSEMADDYLNPMLETLRQMYQEEFANGRKLNLGDIPENLQAQVRQYINQVKSKMPAAKLASMKYAEEMRDFSLLNYKKQTGMDQIMNVIMPYQFWYTRTMMNWSMRMLEKPALFAMYSRWREMQERMQAEGMPARMAGKIRIPAFLPGWMGGGIWQDPMRQLFPFSQFEDGADRMAQQQNSVKYKAYDVLDELVEKGEITRSDSENAKTSMQGKVWDQAYSAALNDSDLSDPMTMASMMIQPGMYLSIPYYLATGQGKKIGQTPLLRYSKAIETSLSGTAFDALGKGVGLLGVPEQKLREKVMTPAQASFGEFGDFYIERNLTRMVADGVIGATEAKQAMIDTQGEAYQEALDRTRQEVALRAPGILPLIAMQNGANVPQVGWAILNSLYPNGILPTGELEVIGKVPEYNAAWDKYKMGDKEALTNFFNENPAFESRTALHQKPDERLHEYLVSEIYDRVYALPTANKNAAIKQLGQFFKDSFLDKNTKNTDAVSTEQLINWAHTLGAYIPTTVEKPESAPVDVWPKDVTEAYQTYIDEKNKLFPNISYIQRMYYQQPQSKRKSFLQQFPVLKQYWPWNREYIAKHPIIQPVTASNAYEKEMEKTTTGGVDINSFDPTLINQIMYSASTGQDLTPGAWMALQYQWEKMGKPYGSFTEWAEQEVMAQVR